MKPMKKIKRVGPRSDSRDDAVASGEGDKDGDGASKPKRVRTGCLTCRERHLKCDEALPHCNNCKKSNRACKRGVRLNFIDTWVAKPPKLLTKWGTSSWKIRFQDESREVASEYQGGTERYQALDRALESDSAGAMESSKQPGNGAPPNQLHLPLVQGMMTEPFAGLRANGQMNGLGMASPFQSQAGRASTMYQSQLPGSDLPTDSHFRAGTSSSTPGQTSVTSFSAPSDVVLSVEKKEFLDSADETLFMQIFVEEVGLWMDSMDPLKHFSRLLPFHALSEPMLVNAFLACGARHLTLVNPAYNEEKALHYYDTATRYLLKNLQNPERDTVVCATTAVILNVYEIMSERALQRMNHIAGARALIKECGWNARTQGIGSACFWLNVGLEVLSCLHFNWQVAWDPDDWGIDMDLSRETFNGREEVWTRRMLYIVAKVCNFRATAPRTESPDPREQQARTQQRFKDWTALRELIDAWNVGIPRTMHPMAFLYPNQTNSKSLFPEVWLLKRATIVARLFFHTASLLMAQVHPFYGPDVAEMRELQKRHSQMICGIAAHLKDRGVASVALRSLAHAAEVLTDIGEQKEVLEIFDKINRETGWRIGFVYKELMEKWGWSEDPSPRQFSQTHTAARQQQESTPRHKALHDPVQPSRQLQQSFGFGQAQQQHHHHHHQRHHHDPSHSQQEPPPSITPVLPLGQSHLQSQNHQTQQIQQKPTPPQSMQRPPSGIPNPMYAKADFSLPQHPYQNVYVPPNNINHASLLGGLPFDYGAFGLQTML